MSSTKPVHLKALPGMAVNSAGSRIEAGRGASAVARSPCHGPCAGMRVVFINRYYYPDMSATSQMLYDLTRRLARQGVKVTVICSRQLYEDPHKKLNALEVVEGVRVHRVNTTCFGRNRLLGRALDYLSFYVSATMKLLEVVKAGDVVVAKTDPPLISVPAAAVARWRSAVLINWLQDLFPEVASHLGRGKLPKWLSAYLGRLRDWSLRLAHANVAIGTRMQEYLLQRRISPERICVIENWADAEVVQSKPVNCSQLRQRLGLEKKFVVAYCGNLGRAHEYETILRAAAALRHEPDIAFLMIGGGARMQQLKQAVAEQLLDNFVFLPYQPREELADCLAAADVHLACLLPALEGLIVPSKFYGILAAGRPTIFIGDDDGEVARILSRTRCGTTVRSGNAQALVDEILHMKAVVGDRERAGLRARALFVERYTAARGAERWMGLLAELQQANADLATAPGL